MLDINALSLLVGFILALVVAFLVGREIVAWYFKINEAVALLREIRDRLPEPRPTPTRTQPTRPGVRVSDTGA